MFIAWIHWVALGVGAGLLLLTSYAGLILLGLLAVYTAATAFGRAQVETVGPWVAGVAMTAVLFPYLIWLDLSTDIRFLDLATIAGNLRTWGWLVVAVLLSHAGTAILIALGRGTLMASGAFAGLAINGMPCASSVDVSAQPRCPRVRRCCRGRAIRGRRAGAAVRPIGPVQSCGAIGR